MILKVRIECPYCGWGYRYEKEDLNKGYVQATCLHCKEKFWFKITLSKISVNIRKKPKFIRSKK